MFVVRELRRGFIVDFLRHRILREDFVDDFNDGAIVIFDIEKKFLLGVFAGRPDASSPGSPRHQMTVWPLGTVRPPVIVASVLVWRRFPGASSVLDGIGIKALVTSVLRVPEGMFRVAGVGRGHRIIRIVRTEVPFPSGQVGHGRFLRDHHAA